MKQKSKSKKQRTSITVFQPSADQTIELQQTEESDPTREGGAKDVKLQNPNTRGGRLSMVVTETDDSMESLLHSMQSASQPHPEIKIIVQTDHNSKNVSPKVAATAASQKASQSQPGQQVFHQGGGTTAQQYQNKFNLINQRYAEKTISQEGSSQKQRSTLMSNERSNNADIELSNCQQQWNGSSSTYQQQKPSQYQPANTLLRRPARVYRGGSNHRRSSSHNYYFAQNQQKKQVPGPGTASDQQNKSVDSVTALSNCSNSVIDQQQTAAMFPKADQKMMVKDFSKGTNGQLAMEKNLLETVYGVKALNGKSLNNQLSGAIGSSSYHLSQRPTQVDMSQQSRFHLKPGSKERQSQTNSTNFSSKQLPVEASKPTFYRAGSIKQNDSLFKLQREPSIGGKGRFHTNNFQQRPGTTQNGKVFQDPLKFSIESFAFNNSQEFVKARKDHKRPNSQEFLRVSNDTVLIDKDLNTTEEGTTTKQDKNQAVVAGSLKDGVLTSQHQRSSGRQSIDSRSLRRRTTQPTSRLDDTRCIDSAAMSSTRRVNQKSERSQTTITNTVLGRRRQKSQTYKPSLFGDQSRLTSMQKVSISKTIGGVKAAKKILEPSIKSLKSQYESQKRKASADNSDIPGMTPAKDNLVERKETATEKTRNQSVCFDKFRNIKPVTNSLLGLLQCPLDETQKTQQDCIHKPDRMQIKMGLLGKVKMNMAQSGKVQSVDLSSFASKMPSTTIELTALPNLNPTLPIKEKRPKLKEKLTEGRKYHVRELTSEDSVHTDKIINITAAQENHENNKLGSPGSESTHQLSMHMEEQRMFHSSAITSMDAQSLAQTKRDSVPGGTTQKSVVAYPDSKLLVAPELIDLQKRKVEANSIVSGYQALHSVDTQRPQKVFLKQLEGQKLMKQVAADAAGQYTVLNKKVYLDNKTRQIAQDKRKTTFLERKQNKLIEAHKELLVQAGVKASKINEKQYADSENVDNLENQILDYWGKEQQEEKKTSLLYMQTADEDFVKNVKNQGKNDVIAVRRSSKVQIFREMAENRIKQQQKEQAEREEEERRIELKKNKIEYESSIGGDFQDSDEGDNEVELTFEQRIDKKLALDAELEKTILMRMNQEFDIPVSPASAEQMEGEIFSATLRPQVKRRLTKLDVSTPMLRSRRLTEELYNPGKLLVKKNQSSQDVNLDKPSWENSKVLNGQDQLEQIKDENSSLSTDSECMDQFEAIEPHSSLLGEPKAKLNAFAKRQSFMRLSTTAKNVENASPYQKKNFYAGSGGQSLMESNYSLNKSDEPIVLFKEETIQSIFKNYLSFDQIKAMAAVFEKPSGWDKKSSNYRLQKKQSIEMGFGDVNNGNGNVDAMQILDKQTADNAAQVMKELKFKEIFRNQFSSKGFEEVYKDDPMFVYQKKLNEEKGSLLPLINKIKNKMLILKDYTLDSGHCLALAEVWQQLGVPQVDVVYLDNCGVDDEEFASLLKGFRSLQGMDLLYYQQNCFGEFSLEAMKSLLAKSRPNNLRQLKFVQLDTSQQLISDLLVHLSEHSHSLESLSLVEMKLQSNIVDDLCKFVLNAAYLEELDLSWNNFMPIDFVTLMDCIIEKGSLRTLNLSWNLIIDSKDQQKTASYVYPSRGSKFFLRQDCDMTHSQIMANRFSTLIRYSRYFQHLDLTNTGLNEVVFFEMLPALRRTRSLLSFHAGANPGINQKIQDYYFTKLRCVSGDDNHTIPIQKEKNNYKEILDDPVAVQKLMETDPAGLQALDYKSKLVESLKLRETMLQNEVNRINSYKRLSEVTVKASSSDISIQRILGHKLDIPGSGQWRLQSQSDENNCWMCNNSSYCLIFWNASIGTQLELESYQIDSYYKNKAIRQIQQLNEDAYDEHSQVPRLYSSATNWRAKPFKKLFDFLQQLEGEVPDFEAQARELLTQAEQFQFSEDYVVTERDQAKMDTWLYRKTIVLRSQYPTSLFKRHRQLFKSKLACKNPILINYELIEDPMETYVLPYFLKPGTKHFFVRMPTQLKGLDPDRLKLQSPMLSMGSLKPVKDKIFYSRHVVAARKQPIPRSCKVIERSFRENKFEKAYSVFKLWKEDTPEILGRALAHDYKYWKVKKFIKDPQELKEIMEITQRHFPMLKSLFLQTVAKGSDPPDIKQIDFNQFCNESGIVDDKLPSTVIDVYFAATNFEEEEQDGNDDRALIRFELLEILVRIVRGKYIESKRLTNMAEGLEKLIQEHILPMHDKHFEWQSFRDKHLWTFHVNEILEKNLDMIERVYEKLKNLKMIRRDENIRHKLLTPMQLCENISNYTSIGVPKSQLYAAFILSKCTVELENDTPEEYTKVRLVEFLEFIGRVAYARFKDDPEKHLIMGLENKIYIVLKDLFTIIGEKALAPNDENELESDSDNDY